MNKIVVGIGVVLIVAGLFSQFYTFTEQDTKSVLGYTETDTDVKKPYQAFALPVLLLGVVLVGIGAFIKR